MLEEYKALLWCSKFPRVGKKFFAKIVDFGTRRQEVSPALERFVSMVRHPTTAAVRHVLISIPEVFLSA